VTKKKRQVIQRHHISYDPEITVALTRGEHWAVTQLNRHKRPSRGFITCLKVFIALHEGDAKEVSNENMPDLREGNGSVLPKVRKAGRGLQPDSRIPEAGPLLEPRQG
jgi:hypothetical protein